MHSFLDLAEGHTQTMLWVQVYGMPIAFIVRAIVILVRYIREPAENHAKYALRIAANLLFAASCWGFPHSKPLAVIAFVVGIGLSIKAFTIARAQAIIIGESVKAARRAQAKPASIPVSIKNSRLGKRRSQIA
jgi:hypothetical protein